MASSSNADIWITDEDEVQPFPYPSHVNTANFISIKLSGKTNYRSWQEQMMCLLDSHDVLGFIDGTTKCNEGNRDWKRSDTLVKGWIFGSLTQDVMSKVVGLPTSQHVWKQLKHSYDVLAAPSSSTTDVDQEFDQLYEYPTHVNTANFLSIKLSGKTNYRSWQEQMRCLLDSHDMLGFINGKIKCNEGNREWERSDTLVKGWIFGSLTEDVMYTVLAQKTSQDVWERLQNNYDVLAAPTFSNTNSTSEQDSTHSSKYGPLYEAIEDDDWEKAKEYFNKDDKDALTEKINDDGDTPLHVAVDAFSFDVVEYLLKEINPESAVETLVCKRGQNPLHRAALVNSSYSAEMLIEKNPNLLFLPDQQGLLPIHIAILQGNFYAFECLLEHTKKHLVLRQQEGYDNPFKGENAAMLLKKLIRNGFLEDAYKLIKEYPDMARRAEDFPSLLKSIAGNLDAYLSGTKYNFYQNFIYHHVPILEQDQDLLIGQDIKIQVVDPTTPIAKGRRSCFNSVIKWIYGKLWKGLLHGQLAPIHRLNRVSGAALQMQRELQWFEKVKKIALPKYSKKKNKKQETPMMVFRREHKELRKEGEEWMKKTADSYTITAALIITIVFAAAITVPGGNSENTGKPIYTTNPGFIVFMVSDAISLFTSTTSLLLCLSILTTNYRDEDFLYRLPKRLILGLGMLFISVTSMMIAFSATLYIMFAQGKAWILYPIAALTCLPIISFVTLQLPLPFDLYYSTYGQGIFVKQNDGKIKLIINMNLVQKMRLLCYRMRYRMRYRMW